MYRVAILLNKLVDSQVRFFNMMEERALESHEAKHAAAAKRGISTFDAALRDLDSRQALYHDFY